MSCSTGRAWRRWSSARVACTRCTARSPRSAGPCDIFEPALSFFQDGAGPGCALRIPVQRTGANPAAPGRSVREAELLLHAGAQLLPPHRAADAVRSARGDLALGPEGRADAGARAAQAIAAGAAQQSAGRRERPGLGA